MRTKRCLFGTKSGFLGIGPGWAKEGTTYVTLGGSVPLMQREGDGEAGIHELFDECYMHGIMNGEDMKITKKEGFEYRVFVLG
jgi:hypothetical protein